MVDETERTEAAVLARRYLAGTLEREVFLERFSETTDPLIQAVGEAILFEPPRSRLPLSKRKWEREFRQPVEALIAELEKGEAGIAPETRVAPRVTVPRILGWALFALFAGASAAEHAVKIWRLVRYELQFPLWRLLYHSAALAVLSLATLVMVGYVLTQVNLYRTRHRNR
jgi:hypothetical protein